MLQYFMGMLANPLEVPAALQPLQSKVKMFNFSPEENGKIFLESDDVLQGALRGPHYTFI